MKFRPLHDRVVVKRIDAEQSLPAESLFPTPPRRSRRRARSSQSALVAVIETGKLIPIDLKVGDTVLFGKWSGTEVKLDGEELLIMKESDVMGVIEGGAAKHKKAA